MTWWQGILFILFWLAVGAGLGWIMGSGIKIADKKEHHDQDS